MVLSPIIALLSWMAARSVQAPEAVAHTALPGSESTPSEVLFTTK
jgi:hypothetical protein